MRPLQNKRHYRNKEHETYSAFNVTAMHCDVLGRYKTIFVIVILHHLLIIFALFCSDALMPGKNIRFCYWQNDSKWERQRGINLSLNVLSLREPTALRRIRTKVILYSRGNTMTDSLSLASFTYLLVKF